MLCAMRFLSCYKDKMKKSHDKGKHKKDSNTSVLESSFIKYE